MGIDSAGITVDDLADLLGKNQDDMLREVESLGHFLEPTSSTKLGMEWAMLLIVLMDEGTDEVMRHRLRTEFLSEPVITQVERKIFVHKVASRLSATSGRIMDAHHQRAKAELAESKLERERLHQKIQEIEQEIAQQRLQREDIQQAARRFANRILPQNVRNRIFEPYFQELLEEFTRETAAGCTSSEFRASIDRFERAVRRAVLLSLYEGSKSGIAAGFRWVIVAVLGDNAVKLVYWLCLEVIRRLS